MWYNESGKILEGVSAAVTDGELLSAPGRILRPGVFTSRLLIFMTGVMANAHEVDVEEMLVSGGGLDPNFGLPEPGMDPPTRPPIGKG